MNRKEFMKKMAIGGSILFTAPVLITSCGGDDESDEPDGGNGSSNNEIEIDLENNAYASLSSIGGFAYNGNIIIFRTDEETYRALSKVCTHQQCTVSYNHSRMELLCPCHGSVFSVEGNVIEGPAPTSLKSYTVKIEGNKLYLS